MKRIVSKIIVASLICGIVSPLQAEGNISKIAVGFGLLATGLTAVIATSIYSSFYEHHADRLKEYTLKNKKLDHDAAYLNKIHTHNNPNHILWWVQESSINSLSLAPYNRDMLRFTVGVAGTHPDYVYGNGQTARQKLDQQIAFCETDVQNQKQANSRHVDQHEAATYINGLNSVLWGTTSWLLMFGGLYQLLYNAQ